MLNATKTKALVTGTRLQVAKFDQSSGITISNTTVRYSSKIRVLGVIIDSELSLDDHVTSVIRACNYHIRSLHYIRHLLNKDAANTIACSIVFSRLDYCNAVLCRVSDHNINRLQFQRVQNNLARVVCATPYRASVTGFRHSLHWLAIRERVTQNLSYDLQSAPPSETGLS